MHHRLHAFSKSGENQPTKGGRTVDQIKKQVARQQDDAGVGFSDGFAGIIFAAHQAKGGLNAGLPRFHPVEQDVAPCRADQVNADFPRQNNDIAIYGIAGTKQDGAFGDVCRVQLVQLLASVRVQCGQPGALPVQLIHGPVFQTGAAWRKNPDRCRLRFPRMFHKVRWRPDHGACRHLLRRRPVVTGAGLSASDQRQNRADNRCRPGMWGRYRGRAIGVHGPTIAGRGGHHIKHFLAVKAQFVSQRRLHRWRSW